MLTYLWPFVVVLMIAMPVHCFFISWPSVTYPVEKASAEISKAEAVNDLQLVSVYVDSALKELEGLHGNPCWWYPTVNTDWGRIKENLRSISDSARNLESEPSMFAYQQMLHNLEDELDEIQSQLVDSKLWMTVSSRESLFFTAFWLLLLISAIVLSPWEDSY